MERFAIDKSDLVEATYQQIRAMILKGELAPGQKLVQESIAERLGVSRTPVLHAITRLEKEMLVIVRPRKGAYVRELTLDELLRIVEIRIRLESLAARYAASAMNEVDFLELDEIMSFFEQSVELGDTESQKVADLKFHDKILRAGKDPILIAMLGSMNLVSITNLRGLIVDPWVSCLAHREIIVALKSRNPETADQAMQRHLGQTKERLIHAIRRRRVSDAVA